MYAIVNAADAPQTSGPHQMQHRNSPQNRPAATHSPRYRPGPPPTLTPQESPLRMPSSSEGTPLVTFRSMPFHNGTY